MSLSSSSTPNAWEVELTRTIIAALCPTQQFDFPYTVASLIVSYSNIKDNIILGVVGYRNYTDYQNIKKQIDIYKFNYNIMSIVSGGCRGVDVLAIKWARANNVQYKEFKPD